MLCEGGHGEEVIGAEGCKRSKGSIEMDATVD
jgi:hypothetical protein